MEIGKYNRGKIVLITEKACFIDLGGENDIFLPPWELPEGAVKGDEIDVFVYNTSSDEYRSTTVKPYAVMGEFASLEVTDVTGFGMFLDWGLQKDLFVPSRNIRVELKPGDLAVVKIVPDYAGKGVIGTCHFDDLFEELPENAVESMKVNKKVELIVYGFSRLGARVIVDKKYSGMLYENEIFENLKIGEQYTGYIKKIREDGLIDAALQPQGFRAATKDAREIILDALENSGGFLALHDKSSAEEIKKQLLMSKKVFKKSIGGLYREKFITIEDDGIRLLR
ncbi:MAG: S1-like domain-containing RNA-binding protein [Spirochaetales bacterium]|uniref:S1-like domain-containing RNA-binding protein n=1 Tax=Candidatus Thalassospirochaeta sargassi TaxID=3119039 RepID=A0AAJ1IAJ0_9SPIO|nr:S1-like domain-containing RNA-binding protein [Spirochaetales bacterium]